MTNSSDSHQPHEKQDAEWWISNLEEEFIHDSCARGMTYKAANDLLAPMRTGADKHMLCWSAFLENKITRQRLCRKPEQVTMSEAMAERLPVIWADHRVWSLLRSPNPGAAMSVINRVYGIVLPFTKELWFELLEKPAARGYLFPLMVAMPRQFVFRINTGPDAKEVRGDNVTNVLLGYFLFEGWDFRPSLAKLALSPEALDRIHRAAERLSADARYCRENGNRVEDYRAPSLAHRIRNLEEAALLERMVGKLRRHPDYTDYRLAKEFLGVLNGSGRKLAREARLLAHYRDQLPVVFHKSRGDKTAGI